MSKLQSLVSKLYPYRIKTAEEPITPDTKPNPPEPSWVQQQTSKLIDKGTDELKGRAKNEVNNYLTNNWRGILRDAAVLSGVQDKSVEAYNQLEGPEVTSAITESVLPSVRRAVHSPSWKPFINASRDYLQTSTPDERDTLARFLSRFNEGDYIPWPKSSPWMASTLPSYYYYSVPSKSSIPTNTNSESSSISIDTPATDLRGNNSYIPDDPMLAAKKIFQRVANPASFAWDIPWAYNKGVKAGVLPSYTFKDYLKGRNQTVADWLRTGSSMLDYNRALADAGTSVIGQKGMEKAFRDNLDYLSTGIPKGITANLYNAMPVAADLAGKGMYSLGAHGLGDLTKKLLTRAGAKAIGGPVSMAISLPVDVANLSGVVNNIEKQTSLNSYSNYDPKTNTYKAPFYILKPGSNKAVLSDKSIIMAPTTFGEHPYGIPKLFSLEEWANNDAYKYQRAYLDQLRKEDPENKRGIPYESFEGLPFLPVFTERGNYVLAVPPRTRNWGEYLEDWDKYRNGEPITLRNNQGWMVPVDNSGNPIPAKMPEDDRWFAGARDAMGKTWTSVYNYLGGKKKNRQYDPALPIRLYGREIRKAHGKLSPHPVFTHLNEAWGTLQSRQKALEERQNQLKLKAVRAGGNALAWATDSELVREANQLLQDITAFKQEVMNLYEQEDRLQKDYDSEPEPSSPEPTGSSYLEMALPQVFKKSVQPWQQRMY